MKLLSKLLVSIIVLLVLLVFIKVNPKYKDILLNDSISFNYFNKIFSEIMNVKQTVTNNHQTYKKVFKYQNGYKLLLNDNFVEAVQNGIVVFIGDRDEFNNCLIVQGFDGIDLWYCNIEEYNAKIYDYINIGTIIGKTNEAILIGKKEGKFVDIEYLVNEI